jgi:hypothetical protein
MLVKYEANPAGNQTQSIKFASGVAEVGDEIEVTAQEYSSVTRNGYLLTVVEDKPKAETHVMATQSSPAGASSPSTTPAPSA